MLVEFRVKNYRSFKDEQVLSMVAGKDDSLPGNTFEAGKLKLLKSAAIYGPNASGKSNLIRALMAMKVIVSNSAQMTPDDIFDISQFLLGRVRLNKPSSFEVTFFCQNVRYQYGFTATSNLIHDEWLFAYPKAHSQMWFRRTLENNKPKFVFGRSLKGAKEDLSAKTRNNALFLSVAAQWNHEQLTNIYDWFGKGLQGVHPEANLGYITARYLKNKKIPKSFSGIFQNTISSLLKGADFGITNINVKESELDIDKFEFDESIPKKVRQKLIEDFKKKHGFTIRIGHKSTTAGKEVFFPLEEESRGTQRLFQLIGPCIQTLFIGSILIIDELESSMHPLLARKLVEFFNNPKVNKSNAQLIFATHDTNLLDPDLLRRDQIWFTEKGNDGASKLYPLSDYKPRIGEALQKGYLSGRYGAIPILDNFGIK